LFKELRTDWNANVVRLALYTSEYGGYCTGGDKVQLRKLVDDGVQFATDNDLYVIVDWHVLSEQSPLVYADEAEAFFADVSAAYADHDNVIFEICNEPNGSATWADVKEYANRVIPIIRKNDPNAVILVGTPTWSQDVDKAAADPLAFDNVMYCLHFYAATHKDDLRQKMVSALDAGLPVFVSEFGICDASGNGAIDEGQADTWVALLDERGVSYVMWNLSNKDESSAMFKPSCDKSSGFTDDDLSQAGAWLKKTLG
jgi:endoglucanase